MLLMLLENGERHIPPPTKGGGPLHLFYGIVDVECGRRAAVVQLHVIDDTPRQRLRR